MKRFTEAQFKTALRRSTTGSYDRHYMSDAMVFACVLVELGVKTMEPTINWISGRTGDVQYMSPHRTSYHFTPYVGVDDQPLPWALARHFDVGYMGGASSETDRMQICFTTGSNKRYYTDSKLYPASRLTDMAERFAGDVYRAFTMLKTPHVAETIQTFERKQQKERDEWHRRDREEQRDGKGARTPLAPG